MGIISSLVGAVDKLRTDSPKTHKSDLLNYFSIEEQMLTVLLTSFTPDIVEKMTASLKNPTDPDIMIGKKCYEDYVRALPSNVAQMERARPFSTIIKAVSIFDTNEKIVLDKYLTLFNQAGNDVSWENMRLTQILVMSYFARASEFATWAFYLLMYFTPVEDISIPPYRKDYLIKHTTEAADYAAITILNQHQTIDKRIESIRKSGKDLLVYNDGVSMDQYVDDSILNDEDTATLSGVMRNPIAMFMSWKESRRLDRIEQIRARINWLRAKVTKHAVDVAQADPDSEEYKKAVVLLQRYSDILSSYDHKLEREMN